MLKKVKTQTKANKSFITQSGYKGILSPLLSIPSGLLEPSLCKSAKCIKLNAAITNGKKKCKLKNLFNVALFTVNPPHNQSTIE
jgi:hypothetical protein